MAKYIINKNVTQSKKLIQLEDEAECVVITAAKLKSEIKNIIQIHIQQMMTSQHWEKQGMDTTSLTDTDKLLFHQNWNRTALILDNALYRKLGQDQ